MQTGNENNDSTLLGWSNTFKLMEFYLKHQVCIQMMLFHGTKVSKIPSCLQITC